MAENSEMMCPIQFYLFLLKIPCALFAQATERGLPAGAACLLKGFLDRNCNGNGHTNHGVVTCADETHHLYVSGNGG